MVMKKFKDVKIGDKTIDYNGEEGIVVRKAKKGDFDYKEMTLDWDGIKEVEGEKVIEVEGDEYGAFGGFGKVIFIYGYDGAYVPL